MTYLSVKTVSTKNFFHDSTEKLLIGEASSLQLRGFGRLYADSCDLGLALYNPNSELTSYWYLVDTRIHDGDVRYWDLKPCNPQNDLQRRYTMRIFND